MRRLLQLRSIVVLTVLLITAPVWAQATAELTGRVTDESGGVLPGVTVTVTQTDTGFTRSVVTEANGLYVVSNLPTGPYRLEVALQGFRTYLQTGIVLQVAATPTINVVLSVGSLEGGWGELMLEAPNAPAQICSGPPFQPLVCSFSYPIGTVVTVTAAAASDSALESWTGACSGRPGSARSSCSRRPDASPARSAPWCGRESRYCRPRHRPALSSAIGTSQRRWTAPST